MAKKSKVKAKAAPVEEIEEDEELDELAEDEETEAAPRSKRSDDVEFGVSDLCALVLERTGKEYSTRDMRALLRKMAREDKARINREVIPGNRARYNWPGGAANPEVKAVLKAVKAGEIEEGRKAALEELKQRKARQLAADDSAGKKTKKGKKAKKAAPVVEEDEDLDDVDFEDDDE